MKNFILILAFLLLQGQVKAQSTTERTTTDLCDADEFDEMARDHYACYVEAGQTIRKKQFDFALIFNSQKSSTERFHDLQCDLLKLKLACDDKFVIRCYPQDKVENFKLHTMEEEIERAKNYSQVLGDDYVRNCDALRNYESAWVRKAFGSTKCSFTLGKRVIAERNECEETVIAYRRVLTSYSGLTADDFKVIYCEYNKALLKCNDPVKDCTAGETRASFEKSLRKMSQEIEQSIRDIGGDFRDFSFDLDCPKINRGQPQPLGSRPEFRKKRSAELLSGESLAAAQRVFSIKHERDEDFFPF